MVLHYTLMYGFHTLPNMFKNLFSTDSGAYGSHTLGHSVEPLVHCYIDSNFHWLWILKIPPIWDSSFSYWGLACIAETTLLDQMS